MLRKLARLLVLSTFLAGLFATGVAPFAAGADPVELVDACVKPNGLTRYVATAGPCKKNETLVAVKPGPTYICVKTSGSMRRVASPSACVPPPPARVVITLPPSSGSVLFCAADGSGVLRHVTTHASCTATEFPVYSGAFPPPPDAAPAVSQTSPLNGATDVAVGSDITVTFSEAVNVTALSFGLECPDGSPFIGSFGVAGTGTATITINPNGDLPFSTVCEVTVLAASVFDSDADDPPDTMVSNFVFSFTTAAAPPQDTAPSVTATTPTNGASDVAVGSDLTVTFSESVSFSAAAFDIECPDSVTFPGGFATSGSGTATATVNPTGDLPASTTCVVTIAAANVTDTDADDPPDNMAADFVFSFTTAAAPPPDTAPSVTTTIPANGAADVALDADITVNFSESVAASASSATLECPAGGPVLAVTISGSPGTQIQIDPAPELPASTECTVTVLAAGITDSDADDPPDNPTSNYVFRFTTAAAPPPDTAPSVTTTIPANGAVDVALDADITVNFSESVAASNASFTLECPAATPIAFSASGSPGTQIQVDPTPELPASTTCVVTVLAAGITDSDADDPPDTMTSNFGFSFTTAAAPPQDTAPSVTGTTPLNGGTDVATSSNIAIDFSEQVAFTNASFLLECPDNTPIGFNVSSSPGTTATLDPVSDLPTSTECVVTVLASGISDSDANDPPDTMTANVLFTFTTAGAVDIPPTANNDTATVSEDAVAGAINVLGNDSNADGGPINIASASDPANGTVVLTGGSIGAHTGLTYEPDPNFCNDPPGTTTDDFTYTLNGGSTATVAVTVTCVDDAPSAADDSATVSEDDTATAIDVLANDVNADGGEMTIASASDPANGTVVLTGGSLGAHTGLTYEPDPAYCNGGSPVDTFTYTLNGGSTATVSVTVLCTGDVPPTANNDSATVAENAGATAIDVLGNDSNADGGPMNIASASDPANGTVVLTGGSPGAHAGLTYEPDTDFCNDPPGTTTDDFTYTLNGGSTATVSVTVTCGNNAPVVTTTAGQTSYSVGDPGVVVDAGLTITDADGSALASAVITIGTGAQVGDVLTFVDTATITGVYTAGTFTLTLSGTDDLADYQLALRSITFSTPGGSSGGDRSVGFTVNDGLDASNTATKTVDVAGGNSAPVANDDSGQFFTTDENATNFNMGNVLDNDTDADLDTLTVTGFDAITTKGGAITQVNNGLFAYNANGLFESLQVGESDTDTFTYTIDDGNGGTDTATVTLTINGVNDAPDAVDDSGAGFTADEDGAFDTGSVLANDTDVESDVLGIFGNDATSAKGATVTNNLDGTFDYDPGSLFQSLATGESTTDTFTYTVTDGNGGTDSATVTITITGNNDGPDAVDDTPSTDEDTPVTISVLTNDTDPDATDVLTVTGTGTLSNGGSVLIVNANTQVQFTPGATFQDLQVGQTRQTSFTYTISDGNGGSDTATVTVTVSGVNDAPVADDELITGTDAAVGNTTLIVNDASDGAPTGPGGPAKSVSGDLLDGDTDVDGPNALVIVAGTFATNGGGSVTIEADGDFVFTPAVGTSCNAVSDFFDYTVSDGAGSPGLDVGRVTMSLSGCVWYVRNNAGGGGDGRSATPFNTIAQAGTASAAGSTIYVHAGDGTTTNLGGGVPGAQLVLDDTQALVGEAVALVINGTTLNPAGARPQLGLGLALGSVDTVTGVALAPNAVAGILAGGGDLHGTIADVIISSNFGGIQLQGAGGIWSISGVSVTSSLLDAIQVSGSGTFEFVAASTISVTATGGRAIALSGATTTLAGQIDSVTASTAATTGIFIDDTLGSLAIDDVNLTTTSTAIDIDSANDITIMPTGDGTVSSTGPAIDVTTDGANPANGVDITLNSCTSSGGAFGVRLLDIGDGNVYCENGTLSGHTSFSLDVQFGSGAVQYLGVIGNGTGGSVNVVNRSGGTVVVGGSVTDTNDAGGGINLDNNDNSTIAFGGNLVLNTGASAAFVATNGGTVTAQGNASTITTTTGAGVNISGTNIGAAHVTFDTVNVDGSDAAPTNGVLVSGTGSAGSFSITGTGSAGTGGTIQDASGDGIRLVNTLNPSLNWMTVTSNLGSGIQVGGVNVADVVAGASLQNLVVSANGNDSGAEDGIKAQNLTGTATFGNLNVSGAARHNVSVTNNTGTLTSLAISGSSIHDNAATSSNGLVLIADGTAVMTATIGTTTFTSNRVNGVLAQTLSAGTLTVTATGGTYTNNFVAFELTHASSGSLTGTLTGATITNAINGCSGTASPCGAPVNLFLSNQASSNAGSILRATINNNTINNGGSANAPGIWMHTGTPVRGHARLLITNNTITGVNQNGIELAGGGCNTVNVPGAICDATVDATITGNNVTVGVAGGDAVHMNVGTAGTLAGHNDTLVYCAGISGNTLDTDTAGASAARLRVRSLSTIRLPGYTGSPTDTTAVNTFVNNANTEAAGDPDPYTSAVQAGSGGFQNTSGGVGCLQPDA